MYLMTTSLLKFGDDRTCHNWGFYVTIFFNNRLTTLVNSCCHVNKRRNFGICCKIKVDVIELLNIAVSDTS